MASRQGQQMLAVKESTNKITAVKLGGAVSRNDGLGVTLVDNDPLIACVDTVNNRVKVDIEDVTGMGLATESTLSTLDGKITQGVDTDLSAVQQVGIYGIKPSTSEWASLHMTNGHNLKVSIEETNGTADLATETTLDLVNGKLPSALDDDRLKIFKTFTWDTSSIMSSEVIASSGGSASSSVVDLSVNGGEFVNLFATASSAGTIEAVIQPQYSPDNVTYFNAQSSLTLDATNEHYHLDKVPRYFKLLVTNNDTSDDVTVSITVGQYS